MNSTMTAKKHYHVRDNSGDVVWQPYRQRRAAERQAEYHRRGAPALHVDPETVVVVGPCDCESGERRISLARGIR